MLSNIWTQLLEIEPYKRYYRRRSLRRAPSRNHPSISPPFIKNPLEINLLCLLPHFTLGNNDLRKRKLVYRISCSTWQ